MFEKDWLEIERGFFDKPEDFDLEAVKLDLRKVSVVEVSGGWDYVEVSANELNAIAEKFVR